MPYLKNQLLYLSLKKTLVTISYYRVFFHSKLHRIRKSSPLVYSLPKFPSLALSLNFLRKIRFPSQLRNTSLPSNSPPAFIPSFKSNPVSITPDLFPIPLNFFSSSKEKTEKLLYHSVLQVPRSVGFLHERSTAMVESERKYITQEDLKTHNIPGDLWISIQGKVYDVSDWVKEHPGGETPLLNLAGNDVTDAFIAYHPGTSWQHLDKLFTGYYLKDFEVSEVSRDYRILLNEFSKLGLFDKKGHGVFLNFMYISIMFSAVIWGVCCSDSLWIHLGSGFLLGVAWILSAYLGHDSGHYVIMCNKKWNKIAQLLTGNCLTGISIAWWKWTHNAHHISCNSLDYDPDLQHIPVFAVSTKLFGSLSSVFYGRKMEFDSVARTLISYQHFTYYPVMIFGRINLFIQTFLLLFSKRPVPDRAMNIIGIAVFWTWFPLLVLRLPNFMEMALFVLVSFSVTAFQHVQFTLNHFSADVYVGKPVGNDWFQKQTEGSIDITCPSWMDWAFGGLQFQLEHHLFPRLPRCHLRKISPVVQEYCKKHGLPYRSLSWFAANVRTIQTLRTAALQARDLTKGAPKNLLWEAINIHG